MISFVLAMSENRVIGINNTLPWHLPADLKYFRQLTMGHPVVMGRKTFESIGKPLPGRENIILTRKEEYQASGCRVVHSTESMSGLDQGEIFVIGGAEIFKEMLPYADRLYITMIHGSFEGDTFFPEIDSSQWRLASEQKGTVDEKNVYEHEFLLYERIHG
jgi:dihydrofolate reductase